jgi:Tol biopolymer transport system component
MDADGSNVEQMGSTETIDNDPAWSPNGWWLAFDCASPERGSRICVMGVAEQVSAQLSPNSSGWDSMPVWSPDSSGVAYRSVQGGDALIMFVNSDGTQPASLNLNGAPGSWVK